MSEHTRALRAFANPLHRHICAHCGKGYDLFQEAEFLAHQAVCIAALDCQTCHGDGYTERDVSDELRGTYAQAYVCAACGGDRRAKCAAGHNPPVDAVRIVGGVPYCATCAELEEAERDAAADAAA